MLTEIKLQKKREAHALDRKSARNIRARRYVSMRARALNIKRELEEKQMQREIAKSHEAKKKGFFSKLSAKVNGVFRGVR